MDVVKRGRSKVKEGDCVSIPSIYFGKAFADQMVSLGFTDDRVIGRVTNVVSNRDFGVLWDMDEQSSDHMSSEKVTIEPFDTPRQIINKEIITESDFSTVTTDDYQPLNQGTSRDTEIYVEVEEEIVDEYLLVTQVVSNKNKTVTVNVMRGKMCPTKPGDRVHNRELLESQRKFQIEEVLVTDWEGFNEDVHCAGSFVAWELEDTVKCKENEVKKKQKFELRIVDSQVEKQRGNGKFKRMNNKKGPQKRTSGKGKAAKGKAFRKKYLREMASDSNEEEEEEEEMDIDIHSDGEQESRKITKSGRGKEREQESGEGINKGGERKSRKKESNHVDSGSETEIESETEDEVEEFEASDNEVDKNKKTKKTNKKDEWKKEWKKGGWTIDPYDRHPYGPKLHITDYVMLNEINYLLRFLPIDYLRNVVIPETNTFGRSKHGNNFKEITFDELMTFLSLTYLMEVVKLPDRRMHWMDYIDSPIIPTMKFNKLMSRHRFETFLSCLQFSSSNNKTDQVLDFLESVNQNLINALTPGDIITLDESMIKSYHHDLYGKIKIKRKPRPIGNELKDVSDSR